MSEILVVAEHRHGELAVSTLEVIAAAGELKKKNNMAVVVAVLAQEPSTFTEQLSVPSVDEIVNVKVPLGEFQNDNYEAIIGQLIVKRNPAVVLVPHSVDSWGYAPSLAARYGYGFATDVFALSYDGDELIATRAAYSEKMQVELDFPGKETILITLRGNIFKLEEGSSSPVITSFDASFVPARTDHHRFVEPESTGDVDITQSELILSVGRGVGEENNIESFRELSDLMGFTLGCSRPIADSGWLPKSRQVGQSGKTVSNCNIYIAMGISGSVQHMAGMKHVPNIIAVNTDPEASVFSIAHYGVVADMFDIAEELRNQFE